MIEMTRTVGRGDFRTRIGSLKDDGIVIGQTVDYGGPVTANRVILTYAELEAAMLSLMAQAEDQANKE